MLSAAAIAVITKLTVSSSQFVLQKLLMDWRLADGTKFAREHFMQLVIYCSILMVTGPFFIRECMQFNRQRKAKGLSTAHPYTLMQYALCTIPAVLDVTAVTLSLLTSTKMPATTGLLLKSLKIVVTASLSKPLLGKAQSRSQWIAVIMTVLGVIPIGIAAQMTSNEKKEGLKSAMFLTVVAECLRGFRGTIEEKIMKQEKLSPAFVTFWEGSFGLLISTIVFFGAHFTGKEKIEDTVKIISQSGAIQKLLVANFLLIGIANYSSSLVTKNLSSVANAVISQARPLLTKIPFVLIWLYCKKNGHLVVENNVTTDQTLYGEVLSWWILLEMVGFMIIAYSAMVYGEVFKLPLFLRGPQEEQDKDSDDSTSVTDSTGKDADSFPVVAIV